MSILIKGIKKPVDCGKCFIGDRTICAKGCPLVEVPEPHGRLIDADAIIVNRNDYYMSDDFMEAVNMLVDVPTVIEAEDE